MDINRKRPPKGCKDIEAWFSGTVGDAIRDATGAGLTERDAVRILLFFAKSYARGIFTRKAWEELVPWQGV